MKQLEEIHNQAMNLVEQAYLARLKGDSASSKELIKQAYDKERKVALSFINNIEFEPTRSVLLRGAASLAYECGETREAERLIAIALSGNPPDEIAEELRDILEKIEHEIKEENNSPLSESIELRGILRFADSTKVDNGIIEIIDKNGQRRKIKVPLGMMADIVRPLYEYDVIIQGERKGKEIILKDIKQA